MRDTRRSTRIRDTGVRIARQRLIRYRDPIPKGKQLHKWIGLGVMVWVLWVLFLSDHSVLRLLHLKTERDNLALRQNVLEQELDQAERTLPGANPTDADIERRLREEYNYAREDEIIYRFGPDSTQAGR